MQARQQHKYLNQLQFRAKLLRRKRGTDNYQLETLICQIQQPVASARSTVYVRFTKRVINMSRLKAMESQHMLSFLWLGW